MNPYSIDKLMSETRHLAVQFHKMTGQVLPVSNELARYDVARILHFREPPEPKSGVDLIGGGDFEGKAIQVKARVIFEPKKNRSRIGQLNFEGQWECVVLVLMNANYEPEEMHVATREDLEIALNSKAINGQKSRGAMSVSRFKRLSQPVWAEKGRLHA